MGSHVPNQDIRYLHSCNGHGLIPKITHAGQTSDNPINTADIKRQCVSSISLRTTPVRVF